MANGDPPFIYYNLNTATGSTISSGWDDNFITVSGQGASEYSNAWSYVTPPEAPLALYETKIQDHITQVTDELNHLNQKYNIFDPTFKNCEVLTSRLLFNLIPKGLCEFGVSPPVGGKRNVFAIVKTYDGATIVDTVVDICANQHGGVITQRWSDNLTGPWAVEFRYKNPTSLVKRLIKEGRALKELSIKDAIALSTRYTVSSNSPSQMDLHLINPDDSEGRKFLEKFGKEVGFKTTLAQLLLDHDPIVAEKARCIAQLILQR